jgi:hypothetical protein
VELELDFVAIDLSTAKVSADEANLSFDTVKSLHMEPKITVPGKRLVQAEQTLKQLRVHSEVLGSKL